MDAKTSSRWNASADGGNAGLVRRRLAAMVRDRGGVARPVEILVGALAGLAAVGIRLLIPLRPDQAPTLAVVVSLAIVTTFVGAWAGVSTAIVGGLLSWYLFFNPHSWSLAHGAWVPLLSFVIISTVIVTTSQLYRSSEQRRHHDEVARLQMEADNANFFAREMAHRLKNALAIVQSIAFQTIGTANPDASKFARRLRTLAEANELLSEDVQNPSAEIAHVIEAALRPFDEDRHRFVIADISARIRSQQVISLALAIHELATNAVKYGALSSPDGKVGIAFERLPDRVIMTWKEHDGPKIAAPVANGFGTRLLQRSGMDTRLDFQADGLLCSMGIPIR